MNKPSIEAQIEEMRLLVRKGPRGYAETTFGRGVRPRLAAEHKRNREAILHTLEWVRDNSDAIKAASGETE